MNKRESFTFIDLFSGIGGFHKGATKYGGELLGFSEIEKSAIEYYCKNFNISETENLGDITKIDNLQEHDLLCAGVPCQSWSIAGRKRGFDDDRGQLWNDTIYLLNKSRPKAFIFENVKGLVQPRNKEAFQYILDRIKEAGYYVSFYWMGAMIGRFVGAGLLSKLNPNKTLGVAALMNILLLLVSVFSTGYVSMISIVAIGLFNSIMLVSRHEKPKDIQK